MGGEGKVTRTTRTKLVAVIKELGMRVAIKREAVPFPIAFLTAQFFFKFKSFTLECLGLLLVWCLLSFIQSVFPRARPDHHRATP